MSKSIRTVLTAVAATASLACLAAPAMADTGWQANHPRRAEVNGRLGNQNARIHRKSDRVRCPMPRQPACIARIIASARRSAVWHRDMAATSHSPSSRLNREENHVSRRIGK